ncbi:hypothetical protein F4801DRAFT_547956 [Xylaria longipes]|nr:hypothetical protein F4801DRAFT_547956 [Xylaria longipes]
MSREITMKKIFVRSSRDEGAARTFSLTSDDTPESLRQRIKEGLNHKGRVKMYFPGAGSREIRDQDTLKDHFPNGAHGATINVDLESDVEDHQCDTPGDGLSNDLKIDDNLCNEKAVQYNYIVGINEEVRGRAIKATIVGNKAHGSAGQSNAVLTDLESLKVLVNAMMSRAQ